MVMNAAPQILEKSSCSPCWFVSLSRRQRRWLIGIGLLLTAPLLILATGCNQAPAERPKKPVEVIVTTPVRDEVAEYEDFTGRLDGYRTIDVRARVSGYITEAPFKEGDVVHDGDLLFQIDPRPYEAVLNQAKANLKVAEAEAKVQAKNAARAQKLVKTMAISQEDCDTVLANEEKARANVGAMEAAVDSAKLNLDFTRVTAPLKDSPLKKGRISRRYVDPGNLILADNTILTTLVIDDQLYAYFDVDERTYLDLVESQGGDDKPAPNRGANATPLDSYRGAHASPLANRGANATPLSGQETWLGGLHYPVLMSLANEGGKFEHMGKVDFIDNRVVATSGTIRMRGIFDNSKGMLKSGLFIRIRLPLGKPYQTLLIAAEALQSDQGRTYVYVVNDKNVVTYRRVTVGKQEIDGLRVIKDGLAEGDHVIVSGMQRVRPDTQVETKMRPPPKAPAAPLVKLLSGRQRVASW
jgi:multidrug efflux system membrane fusion protein